MKPFCEIIVADVLPALRAIVANELSKAHGLTQTQISKKLGMTQPAISQYMSELRGRKVKIILSNKKVMELVKKLSQEIAIGDVSPEYIHKKLCEICKLIREEGVICDLHEEACPSIGPCKICFG